jgi:peptidyl-dipeptidase Dcp
MNPLLEKSTLPYGAINYDVIKTEHFLPALKEGITLAKKNIEDIKKVETPTFDNTILALEQCSEEVDYVASVFYPLYSADCTEEISAISQEFSETMTKFGNDISLDPVLFEKVKAVYDQRDSLELTAEQRQVLEKSYKGFARNGALLDEKKKEEMRTIDEELSKLNLNFSENVRKATNAFTLFIDDEKDLEGIPETIIEAAKETAKAKGEENKWAFTLDYPSYGPFMTYCQNREKRKEMSQAFGTRAFSGELDNSQTVLRTVELREKRAELLGYQNHAYYVLEERMAKTPETVFDFLSKIYEKAIPAAKSDFDKLKSLSKEVIGTEDIERYDSAFLSEILKKRELNIDDEMLRPYFKLENVIDGVFQIASKLYNISFEEISDVPKYHEEVKTYKVTDKNGVFVGLFYADFFPRETKRPGAWMTDLFGQGLWWGEVKRPAISIVCNFTKPTQTKPSLLTLNEVLTLFHEFGHALHGLLSKCTYRSVAGTSVYWDFVELPSQIMENWVLEKEALDLFAVHYETGEKMPTEIIDKVKKSQQFLEGLATLRQLSFGYLDMAWHTTRAEKLKNVSEFEESIMTKYDLFPRDGKTNMSVAFGHIFAGGYAAGYYSYKWAEVLDADAFEYFLETGIFNEGTATKFKENILEKGGSEHPMDLYKRFRGKEPSVDALMKRAGFIS